MGAEGNEQLDRTHEEAEAAEKASKKPHDIARANAEKALDGLKADVVSNQDDITEEELDAFIENELSTQVEEVVEEVVGELAEEQADQQANAASGQQEESGSKTTLAMVGTGVGFLREIGDFFKKLGRDISEFLGDLLKKFNPFGEDEADEGDSDEVLGGGPPTTAQAHVETVPLSELKHADAPVWSFAKGANDTLTSHQGDRTHPTTKEKDKHHDGVDIAAPEGTPVYATCRGKVIESSANQYNGNYVAIQTPDGKRHFFLHLKEKGLPVGTEVRPGMRIGLVGHTGRTSRNLSKGKTGDHLHYQVYAANGELAKAIDTMHPSYRN